MATKNDKSRVSRTRVNTQLSSGTRVVGLSLPLLPYLSRDM